MNPDTSRNIQFCFISLLLLFSFQTLSQQYLSMEAYNVDSLELILVDQKGEERVSTLSKLAYSLSYENPDLCKIYADEAMKLAVEQDYRVGIAEANYSLAFWELFQGNYPGALNYCHESLRIYENLNQKAKIAKSNYGIGACHFLVENHEKAIEYLMIALHISREQDETGNTYGSVRDTMTIIGLLSECYTYLGLEEEALKYTLQSYKIANENNFEITEIMLWDFLVGAQYYLIREPDSAKVYFLKALEYPDINPHIRALKYRPLTFLGYMHNEAGDLDTAIMYTQTAFEWYAENGFLYWALNASNTLGWYHFKNNELNLAEFCLHQSEKIFDEMLTKNSWFRYDSLKYIVSYGLELYWPLSPGHVNDLMWSQGRDMYYLLYQINDLKNNDGRALHYHLVYSDAVDTLNKIQRSRETIELQTRYESENKDQQIETLSLANKLKESRLRQNTYFLIGSASLFLLLLMFVYIIFRQNRLKTSQQMLVLQQKLFRSQMNPHFIFNSLASIQNFIVKQDSRQANIYLSRFSVLVRSILDNSIQEYITFEKEVDFIENYLALQKVRFSEQLEYTIEVDEAIDIDRMKIPPMLAQPIIENAIEHGIKHKEVGGTIHIRFRLKNGSILYEIEDDGIGREKAMKIMRKQDKDHKSLATEITKERIHILNKKLKKKISFSIVDLKSGMDEPSGTRVVFEIPVVF